MKGGAEGGPSEARSPTEGGSGGPPPENLKKIDCIWCNQSYSGPSLVNKISLYFCKAKK